MDKIGLVAVGGGAGAVLRYLSVRWIGTIAGGETAAGTLAVNVLGSFLMGLCTIILVTRFPGLSDRFGPLLMTGLLGGFTTFSAYSADTIRLIEDGRTGLAAAYAGGTVLLSIAAVAAGLHIARGIVA